MTDATLEETDDTRELSREERQQAVWLYRAKLGRCPQCNADDLVAGPWGGSSRNVFCGTCGQRWNFHGLTHGIVMIDDGGPATTDDMEHARRVYKDDQPFTPPRAPGLQSVSDNAALIGAQIKTLIPPEIGIILLAYDHSGNIAIISDIEHRYRIPLMQRAIAAHTGSFRLFLHRCITRLTRLIGGR